MASKSSKPSNIFQTVKAIKNQNPEDEKLVMGYIKKTQNELSTLNIPVVIKYIIQIFFTVIADYFTSTLSYKITNDKQTLTNDGNEYNNCMAWMKLWYNSLCGDIVTMKFKINHLIDAINKPIRFSVIMDDPSAISLNQNFDGYPSNYTEIGYFLSNEKVKRRKRNKSVNNNNNHNMNQNTFKKGDIITLIINFKCKCTKFHVNGILSKRIDHITKYDEINIKIGVCMIGADDEIEIISWDKIVR